MMEIAIVLLAIIVWYGDADMFLEGSSTITFTDIVWSVV